MTEASSATGAAAPRVEADPAVLAKEEGIVTVVEPAAASKAGSKKADKGKAGSEKPKAPTGPKPVPYFKLFRYATKVDAVLYAISVICAMFAVSRA